MALAAAPAGAQTLSATPAAVDVVYDAGEQAPEPVTVAISASSGPTPIFQAVLTPGSGTPSTLFALTPVGFAVQVGFDRGTLQTLLSNPGNYTATITVTASGFPNLIVPVTLTIGGQLLVQPTPASLTFNLPSGSTTQTVSLLGTGNTQVAITVVASTASGANWLSVTSSADFTPATLTVTVSTGSLVSGTYNGTITVNGSLIIPVTLVIGANNLTVSPGTFAFSFTVGGTVPAAQVLQLSSGLVQNTFTAQATSTGNWLLVNGVTSVVAGALPANVNVTINPAGLAPGTYQGTVAAKSGDGSTQNVAVTLVVNGLSTIANPTSLVFVAEAGGASPPSQIVLVSPVANATFTATVLSGATWLSVSPTSGPLPAQLTVSVNSTALAAGTYSGTIQVGISDHLQLIAVSLTVSADPVLTTGVGALLFSYFGGDAPPPTVTLDIGVSSGPQQTFALLGGLPSWLQASVLNNLPTTPAYLNVSVTPESLPTGVYLADIFLMPSAQGGAQIVLPVIVNVSGAPAVVTNVTSLTFSGFAGSGPQSQTIKVSAGSALAYTAAASTVGGGNWLSVSPASGTANLTNTSLTVTADATSLAAGTYTASITLTTSEGVVTQVPVTFNVGSGNLTVSPSALTFAYTEGGVLPPAQTVQASGTQSFTAAASTVSSGTWLSVTPTSGTGNVSLTVTVNPAGLAAGTYNGIITLTPAAGSMQTVAVSLTVTSAAVSVAPASLAFAYASGNPNPAPQTLSVTAPSAVSFTATASSSGWLSVTPVSGTTPATLTVSVNPSDLGAGAYTGTILVDGQIPIAVTFTVTSPLPVITRVVNSASYLGGGISPGEIATVFGSFLGPTIGQSAKIDSNGFIESTLANVQVTFNGYPGPVLYASAGQINTVVPYELAGASNAIVEVTFGKASSNSVLLPVVVSAPGIFSADASGLGPGAILDRHNHLVTASNPVSVGSTIQIFATGQGQTLPPGVDGLIEPLVLPLPGVIPAPAVEIGGLPANIAYIGAAPGLVAGALQINAVIPDGVTSGAAPVVVFVGVNGSQPGITVQVQ